MADSNLTKLGAVLEYLNVGVFVKKMLKSFILLFIVDLPFFLYFLIFFITITLFCLRNPTSGLPPLESPLGLRKAADIGELPRGITITLTLG